MVEEKIKCETVAKKRELKQKANEAADYVFAGFIIICVAIAYPNIIRKLVELMGMVENSIRQYILSYLIR